MPRIPKIPTLRRRRDPWIGGGGKPPPGQPGARGTADKALGIGKSVGKGVVQGATIGGGSVAGVEVAKTLVLDGQPLLTLAHELGPETRDVLTSVAGQSGDILAMIGGLTKQLTSEEELEVDAPARRFSLSKGLAHGSRRHRDKGDGNSYESRQGTEN